MKKLSLMSILVMLFSFGFLSCGESEPTISTSYMLDGVATSPSMSTELVNFVRQRLAEMNETSYGSRVLERKVAVSLFDDFCAKLDAQATAQSIPIFGDSWVELRLKDVMGEVIVERKVSFTKNADPKSYVRIIFEEIAPNGDTAKASALLDGLLITPLSLTKSSKEEKEIKTNSYQFYQEFSSYDQATSYLSSKQSALDLVYGKLNMWPDWPGEILYTGKVFFFYEAVNENSSRRIYRNGDLVLNKPSILGSKGWVTTDPAAPFAAITFSEKKRDISAPFFVLYETTIKDTKYDVYRQGKFIMLMDASDVIKYGFTLLDENSFRLIRKDGAEVKDGAVYTRAL